ncbi:ribosome recycling factor [Patescibacteria group bacterium]|nr:ribosome recycling factor [Patescibacteria group bacterium]
MDDITAQVTPKFQKAIEVVKQDLNTIRTGKASPQLIENLIVEAYGTKMKLVELATIAATDANTIVITPFDQANVEAIIKAISAANLGLTAIPEDTRVRVVVPPLSEERRQEYVKLVKTKIEGGKIMIRQIRHDAMEDVSKAEANEDEKERMEKEVQALTDKMVAELDTLAQAKEKELMSL